MKGPAVSILIVNYQCGAHLARCLQSLFAQVRGIAFEVIVVDNASTDDSVAAAQALNQPVHWISLAENVGFAQANNLAAEKARGRYLLLLNPDTELRDDCVTPLVDFAAEHPEAGLVGGCHEDANGNWQRSFGPSIRLRDEVLFALCPGRFMQQLAQSPPAMPAEVGWLAGSFLLVPVQLVREIGLFDSDFFLNDEDIDLAARVGRVGRKIFFHPARGLRHFGGVSKAHRPNATRDHLTARWRYYRKHHSLTHALVYSLCYWSLRGRAQLHLMTRQFKKPHDEINTSVSKK